MESGQGAGLDTVAHVGGFLFGGIAASWRSYTRG